MGWLFSSRWKTKQDVLDHYADDIRSAGYSVQTDGNWVYAEQDGKPIDLIYCLVEKADGEWGYKEISVTCGPYRFNAPLWMVLKVHQIFKDNHFYQGWLAKYPKRKSVLQNCENEAAPELFKEAV